MKSWPQNFKSKKDSTAQTCTTSTNKRNQIEPRVMHVSMCCVCVCVYVCLCVYAVTCVTAASNETCYYQAKAPGLGNHVNDITAASAWPRATWDKHTACGLMTCWCGVIIPCSCQQEREVATKCLVSRALSRTRMCGANSKRSRPLNNTKNNVRHQPVEMITYSGVNDKFLHKQTLTECVPEPYISKLRRPRYHRIEHWRSAITRGASQQYTQRNDCVSQYFWRLE